MNPRRMLSVNLAIKPMQTAGNDRNTQWRFLPVDTVPFVRASPSELVRDVHLLARQDIDRESTCLANLGIISEAGHDAKRHQGRNDRYAKERLTGETNRPVIECDEMTVIPDA